MITEGAGLHVGGGGLFYGPATPRIQGGEVPALRIFVVPFYLCVHLYRRTTKLYVVRQLSLTNRATHLCKSNGVANLIKHTHPYMYYIEKLHAVYLHLYKPMI